MGQTVFVRNRNSVAPIFKKEEKPPIWWLRYVPTTLVVAVFVYMAYILGRVAILPVLTSFVAAYLLNPIVLRIEKSGLRRSLAALVAMLFVGGSILLLAYLVVPDLWAQGSSAMQAILGQFTEKNALDVRKDLRHFSPMLDDLIGLRLYKVLRSPAPLMDASRLWIAGGLTNFLATAA